MKYIKIGKITSPHALKGEVKIISNFDRKDKAFELGMTLYIGESKQAFTCQGHRKHKNFDMIKFLEIDKYEEASKLNNQAVFADRAAIILEKDEYLIDDLVGMELIIEDKTIGQIIAIVDSGLGHLLLEVKTKDNNIYYPYNKTLVTKLSLGDKKITMKKIEGLL